MLTVKNCTIFITILLLFMFAMNNVAVAKISDAFDTILSDVAGEKGAGYRTDAKPEMLVGQVIQAALSFVGVIFLLLMIYGGYLWMTARGNEEEVTKAKNLIKAAIIGLIIVLAAYAISIFVIKIVGEKTLEGA